MSNKPLSNRINLSQNYTQKSLFKSAARWKLKYKVHSIATLSSKFTKN